MPSDVDPQILWETTKCAIRGFCIYFSSTNLFYIGLDKNIILNQRDLVIYWPLG